jgi:hypothetical protein
MTVSDQAVVGPKAAALANRGSALRYWLISTVLWPKHLPSTCRQAHKRRARYLIFELSGASSKTWRCAFGIGGKHLELAEKCFFRQRPRETDAGVDNVILTIAVMIMAAADWRWRLR